MQPIFEGWRVDGTHAIGEGGLAVTHVVVLHEFFVVICVLLHLAVLNVSRSALNGVLLSSLAACRALEVLDLARAPPPSYGAGLRQQRSTPPSRAMPYCC